MANKITSLQWRVMKLSRLHYFYVFALAALIIVYDASKVITPDSVLSRWTMVVIALIVTTVAWFLVRRSSSPTLHKSLVFALILLDIILATTLVYAERGMASKAVALYAVPIAVSGVFANRSALLATASLCTAAYSFAAVKYFVDFFNEGYKVELWTTVAFFSAMFFVLAFAIWIVVQSDSLKK